MAVGENGSLNRTDVNDSAAVDHQSNQNGVPRSTLPIDQNLQAKTTVHKPQMDVFQQQQQRINDNGVLSHHHNLQHKKMNGVDEEGFNSSREMRDLEEMFSKLNPMAAEFVPPSLSSDNYGGVVPFLPGGEQFGFDAFNHAVQRLVTEEQLATLFLACGQVVDCRICGDPNSLLRFAFIEFIDEEGARNALSLAGTVLGFYPVRVLPSKTAIAPVNPKFLPRSEDEREMCARTINCTNIDTKVTQGDVRLFFESFCGEVKCLRLLGDYRYSTRIAFIEFFMAESAIAALNCSGAILGSLPIGVSPSKTPVRPRAPRPAVQ